MNFADTLARLRRAAGLSQEGLADKMDVSRQAVSKWEAGQAMPELEKLIALAEFFDVSLDALVRPDAASADKTGRAASAGPAAPAFTGSAARFASAPEPSGGGRPESTAHALTEGAANGTILLPAGERLTILGAHDSGWHYEYKSRHTLFGLPLLHINLGSNRCAKGVVAVGNSAVGAVAVGGCSVGLISLGGVSAGVAAVGGAAAGLLALGGLAVGAVAVGGLAVGAYALGGAAIASRVASGDAPLAPISIGKAPDADFVVIPGVTTPADAAAWLRARCPGLPRFLCWLLSQCA